MTRILVMGGGLIGMRHAQAIAAHPRATLAGLVDPNPALVAPGGAPRFNDIADVDMPVDGVIIATPTGLHAPHAEAAADRGWPALIEKPVAGTRKDAARVIAAARRVPILIGHHRRYHASLDTLRDAVTGRIGTPVTATLIWAMRKPDPYYQGNWRSAGGSPVMINLVHDIDVLRFVMGEITGIVALPGRRLRGSDRIESGAVALQFASGATGAISFADTAPSPWGFEAGTGENPNIGTTGQDMMWITGTEGGVSFPSLTLWSGTEWAHPATPERLDAPATVPLDAQLDHFLDVIVGAPPRISAEDGAATLDIALKIEEALTCRPSEAA
ncbi:Gfo/Idh/MocA family protein [Pseudaestuariivita atlantica]|uniref:Oxidoreductase n=1 Tax=Pseudaestuariivita atlantica TaxID=1317121 RepID=A0A0L1JV32_9RHOB|nr:Gfo/Idh/MocA family oxidoreductase [Pseudaestuariivita atlantica]KNG95626.1 oxidoreductase [Pseudaestuariivita atlantica]